MKQICGDCLHYNACAAWNIGSLANTDAGNCINFEHIHLYDSVEVVRCKDCKYCDVVDEWERWCLGWGNPARLVNTESFCNHGKRKEDE